MHQLFGSDWVVQTGKFKGHSFSYSGIDGREKLVYSQAIDYALGELGYDMKPKSSVEITAEPKGEYLKDDDTLIFIMCKVKKSKFEPETGLTKVYFTWYELIINISSKKATSTAGGKGHFYSDRSSEIQMEKEISRSVDFDLEL